MRKSTTGNARGGNPNCHRSKVPLLSDVQRVGATTTAPSLPMLWALPPQALGRALTRVGAFATPVAAAYSSMSHPYHGGISCTPGLCLLCTTLLTKVDLCAPGQPRADPCGWLTCRGGAETTAEPVELCN